VCNGLRENLPVTIKQVRPAGRTNKKGFPELNPGNPRPYSMTINKLKQLSLQF
jgi:hypothetical protein